MQAHDQAADNEEPPWKHGFGGEQYEKRTIHSTQTSSAMAGVGAEVSVQWQPIFSLMKSAPPFALLLPISANALSFRGLASVIEE